MKYAFCFSILVVAGIWLLAAPANRSASHEATVQNREGTTQIAANESAAIESLRAIHSAEATYQATTGNGSFGSWNELVRRELLSKDLVDRYRSGYQFHLKVKSTSDQAARSFVILATPKTYDVTGRRTFSIDESGVIRFSAQKDATVASMEPLVDEGGGIEANEVSAVSALRTIFSAEATFQATVGNGDYGRLQELGKERLVDFVLAAGEKNGYLFKIRVEKTSSESRSFFEAHAVPKTYGQTGRKSFFIDDSGVIRGADKKGLEASVSDEPINR